MKNILIVAFFLVASAGASAQNCPSQAPLYCGASGGDWCCPFGDGGRQDVCCPQNGFDRGCTSNGQCSDSPPPGGGGGGGGDDLVICEPLTVEGCSSVEACASVGEAWYEADGRVFECFGASCESAASDLIDYCESKRGLGCSSTNAEGQLSIGLLAMLGLLFRRRKT